MVVVLALFPPLAIADHGLRSLPGSNFEIDTDANLKVDHDSPSIDWETGDLDGLEVVPDEPTGRDDDSFGQGSKEDTAVPAPVTGSIPNNKSDLLNFGFYLETVGDQEFLHLFWHRVQEPTGTTNMDFEFNKNAVDGDNAELSANGVTPVRSDGDFLVQYDLSQGGDTPSIHLSRWLDSEDFMVDADCEAANSRPCWSEKELLSGSEINASTVATGTINTSAIDEDDSGPLGQDISSRTFGEATLDWDALTGAGCASFGSAYLKSRSSDSFNSALKDYIAPINTEFTRCGSLTWLKVDGAGSALAGATFEVCRVNGLADVDDPAETDPADECWTVKDNEADPDTSEGSGEPDPATPDDPESDEKSDEDDADGVLLLSALQPGDYTIVETIPPDGYIADDSVKRVEVTPGNDPAEPIVGEGEDAEPDPFVNVGKYKVVVLTCDTEAGELVDSTVELDDGDASTDLRKETLVDDDGEAPDLNALCDITAGAYDGLTPGDYTLDVELPDLDPFFPEPSG